MNADFNLMIKIARARLGLGQVVSANAKMRSPGATAKKSNEHPNRHWNLSGIIAN